MTKDLSEVRKDIYYYQKVKDFVALSEAEKSSLAMSFFSKEDYFELRLDEVVEIINQTRSKVYDRDEDWSQWLV